MRVADLTNFDPLSPYGERLRQTCTEAGAERFQPTLPVWGETTWYEIYGDGPTISTHSPRMGRDPVMRGLVTSPGDFNPLSPYVERRHFLSYSIRLTHFNPLSPYGERLLSAFDDIFAH